MVLYFINHERNVDGKHDRIDNTGRVKEGVGRVEEDEQRNLPREKDGIRLTIISRKQFPPRS